MSIPILVQTYDEVRRLAIAGSVVALGDFRLKKLVAPLEQAGQKAPVFARVAESVNRLVSSREQTSAAALLDLATLINSILYTQGETGLAGDLAPLPSHDVERLRTQVPARVLKPLIEALTTTGSGRLEIVRDGLDRGAFDDLRLIAPALVALDDHYADVAEVVEREVIPRFGPAILPDLEAGFDPKIQGVGPARRLRLMHKINPEVARPHVRRSLEEGRADLRIAAISCLGDSPEDLPLLLEQVRSRSKEVRAAALRALEQPGEEAARALREAMEGEDLGLAVEPLRRSRNPLVTAALLGEAEARSTALLTTKLKDAKELGPRNERMIHLLQCLEGRDDERTEALLHHLFGQKDKIAAIKGSPGGGDVVEQLITTMAAGSPSVQGALIDAHASLPLRGLGQAFLTACRTRQRGEVFATFSPYLISPGTSKRGAAVEKREVLMECLLDIQRGRDPDDPDTPDARTPDNLDPRWVDLAVEHDLSDLVELLAMPGHAGAIGYLSERGRHLLGKPAKEYELSETLEAMIRIHHPGATDLLIEAIQMSVQRGARSSYHGSLYWITGLIPRLPRDEALPKFEALLPTLPEKLIDQLMNSIAELRQSTPDTSST